MYLGIPCDENRYDLPPATPAPPPSPLPVDENGEPLPYFPYKDLIEFNLANFLFKHIQMPGMEINELMQIWSTTLPAGQDPPFANHDDLYETIDATMLGDALWQSFLINYSGEHPRNSNIPSWMLSEFEV